MEQDLCLIQRRIGLEQLEENVELEKRFSEKDENGETSIDVLGICIGTNAGLVATATRIVAVI
jgi:hypothetical protein